MRTTLPPARARRVGLLYAGLALFVLLAALTARSRLDGLAGARRPGADGGGVRAGPAADAVAADRGPRRDRLAARADVAYRRHLPPSDALTFERLADETDRIPHELVRRGGRDAHRRRRPVARSPDAGADIAGAGRSLAAVALAADRAGRDVRGDPPPRARAGRRLEPLRRPAAGADGRGPAALDGALRRIARPVRLYALAEDGTLVSLPWPPATDTADGAARSEALQLSSRPTLPSFAPEEFFFRFPDGEQDSIRYSGFYVDLGGRGLVSTLTMPMDGGGQAGVLALDLSHDVDWDRFARTIAAPLAATIVHVGEDAPATWTTLRGALL